MAELRYNPIAKDWVMVASHRQSRPQMPKDWCPFCAGSGKVPDKGYTVFRYPNDFPALSKTPPVSDDVAADLLKTRPAYGSCEVLLYSDNHDAKLWELPDENVEALSHMWRECFDDLSSDKEIKYVFLFENRGEMVGVTMPHPHGQAYAYPFVPQKLTAELASALEYYEKNTRNLFLDLLDEELKARTRIVFENEHFAIYTPFFSQVTYGIHVTAKRQVPHIGKMTEDELLSLGKTIRDCVGMYDKLFDISFPYMMCMHNSPVNQEIQGEVEKAFQFHVEFFPPMRSADKQQFFASSETGAGAWCIPNAPEEKAEELRRAYVNYKQR
jgi:UDPglucose--hexose-1-phosphate uridylyltransferase